MQGSLEDKANFRATEKTCKVSLAHLVVTESLGSAKQTNKQTNKTTPQYSQYILRGLCQRHTGINGRSSFS